MTASLRWWSLLSLLLWWWWYWLLATLIQYYIALKLITVSQYLPLESRVLSRKLHLRDNFAKQNALLSFTCCLRDIACFAEKQRKSKDRRNLRPHDRTRGSKQNQSVVKQWNSETVKQRNSETAKQWNSETVELWYFCLLLARICSCSPQQNNKTLAACLLCRQNKGKLGFKTKGNTGQIIVVSLFSDKFHYCSSIKTLFRLIWGFSL